LIKADDKLFKSNIIVPIEVSSLMEISCSRDSLNPRRRRRKM
jgi:hypothetical protein